jgi:spore maturation protein SpmA
MLNVIWLAFVTISFLSACYTWLIGGDFGIWNAMMVALFDAARSSLEIALGLVGIMAFWLGILEIGQQAGLVRLLARILSPLFSRLMPEVPKNHPALSSITLNMAANVFGLDNAATPMGIKAMRELQSLNQSRDTASNAQILFLVINSSSVTLLPVTIFMYRAQSGAANPTDVFLPILIATTASTLVGLLTVAWFQRLPVFSKVVMAYLLGLSALAAGLAFGILMLPKDDQALYSSASANLLLFMVIMGFVLWAAIKRVPVYEAFIKGAKQGFETAIHIVPYLVAMLVAISLLRASGALDALLLLVEHLVRMMGMDTSFVPALPTALLKPFSGSGARAMMIETMQHEGADSFAGRVACIIQGSTETTFYVLAVYFGAAGITKIRHTLICALLADVAGVVAAILIGYLFFPH